MRRLIELFESHGGVFAASDYLTYAAGGLDSTGLFYDTSRHLESLAEVTTLAAQMGLSKHFFSHHALAQQMHDYAAPWQRVWWIIVSTSPLVTACPRSISNQT